MLGSGPAGRQAITPSTGASGERTLHFFHHSEFINERKDTAKFQRMQKKRISYNMNPPPPLRGRIEVGGIKILVLTPSPIERERKFFGLTMQERNSNLFS
jgi:hypothetical protein